MTDYTLQELSEIFENHHQKFIKNLDYNPQDFDLPKALKLIVDEIIKLKS